MTHRWIYELDNIKRLGADGKTMQQIANVYGVSRQRIKQVIMKHIPEWHSTYGKAIRDIKAQKNLDALYTKCLRKWGNIHPKEIVDELYWIQRKKFQAKRANAIRLGYIWEIEFGDLTWPTHCPIFGIELNYFSSKCIEASPSFDQIIPGKGYILGNVQIISWKANRLKNDGTWEDHQKIANYMKSLV